VNPFALRAEDAQQFHRLQARVGDHVRDAGVELGCLAGGEDEVPVAQGEAEPAGDHVEPFVALVAAAVQLAWRGSARVRARLDDQLEDRGPAWVAGKRQPGRARAVNRPRVDPRVARHRGAHELVQRDMVCPRDRQQQLERGPALPGFESRQGADRDLGALGQLLQGDTVLLAQGAQTRADRRQDGLQLVGHALSLP
jgi:hypothetical protein